MLSIGTQHTIEYAYQPDNFNCTVAYRSIVLLMLVSNSMTVTQAESGLRLVAESVVTHDGVNSTVNATIFENFDAPEETHDFDAYSSTILNVTLIACLLLAYYVKQYRLYYLPESAGALMIGVVVGGIARLVTNDLQFFVFVSSY